jgi:hypothetical protein
VDFISFLPEPWQHIVLVIVQVVVAASGLVALLKTVMGKPSPSDPKWKKAVFVLLQGLDWVALNSETVVAKKKRARAEAVVNSLQAMPSEDIEDVPTVHHYRGSK